MNTPIFLTVIYQGQENSEFRSGNSDRRILKGTMFQSRFDGTQLL